MTQGRLPLDGPTQTEPPPTVADGVEFYDVNLTLDETRHADDVMRAYIASRADGDIETPLGLTGIYGLETTVSDCDADHFLANETIELTPDATVWDIMRLLAQRWSIHTVMENFTFRWLGVKSAWVCIILWADKDPLADEDLDRMPFDEPEDDTPTAPGVDG